MTSTDTQSTPCLDDATEQFERRRFQQEIQRRIDEVEDEPRSEKLALIREFKREGLRRQSYDPWGYRKFYEAARVLRDMR